MLQNISSDLVKYVPRDGHSFLNIQPLRVLGECISSSRCPVIVISKNLSEASVIFAFVPMVNESQVLTFH